MTTWTKTPPTEPGWYWIRFVGFKGVPAVAELSGIGWRCDGARIPVESVEFWPVRIEEPPYGPL